MELFNKVLNHKIWEIPTGRIAVFIVLTILLLIVRYFFLKILIKYSEKLAKKTKTDIDDKLVEILTPPFKLFMLVLIFSISIQILNLPKGVLSFVSHLLRSVIVISLFWAFYRAIRLVSDILKRWTQKTETDLDDKIIIFVDKILGVVVIGIGAMVVIQEWNYDITGIVTGLGIGGLAFALAAKDMLSNIFGLLMILGDKPFNIGDFIEFKDITGVVVDIGFRSTRIQRLDRSIVSVPNSMIANSEVTNLDRKDKRRIHFDLGVTYATSIESIKIFIQEIKTMLEKREDLREDGITVRFSDIANSSLNIAVYCYTKVPAWGDYMKTKEEIKLDIVDIARKLEIDFAFPSKSIYIESINQELPKV